MIPFYGIYNLRLIVNSLVSVKRWGLRYDVKIFKRTIKPTVTIPPPHPPTVCFLLNYIFSNSSQVCNHHNVRILSVGNSWRKPSV